MPRTAARPTNSGTIHRKKTYGAPVLFRLPVVPSGLPQDCDGEEETETKQDLELAPLSTPALSNSAANALAANDENSETLEAESEDSAAVDTAEEKILEAERSWWEHWSSGVVLLLLVLALVAATVIALNDSSANPEMLASSDGTEAEEDSALVLDPDLENITIPAVTVSTGPLELNEPADLGSELTLEGSFDAGSNEPLTPELPELTTQSTNELVSEDFGDLNLDEALPTPTLENPQMRRPSIALGPEQDASEEASGTLIPDTLEFGPSSTPSGTLENAAAQQATLQLPTEDRPKLFAEGEGAEGNHASPTANNASTPTGNTGAGTSTYTTAEYSNSAGNFSTASHPSGSQEATTGDQPTTNVDAPGEGGGIRETSTPEMDTESLLRAYQYFRAQAN